MDLIDRQALISEILGMTTFGNVHELDNFVHKCHLDGEHMGGLRDAVFAIVNAPSVQPTYTDEQLQKMQDLHQAEIEKAFDLGREDAMAEIVQCKDCRWQKDQSGSTAWLPCRVLVTPDDFYCGRAERRTDETD